MTAPQVLVTPDEADVQRLVREGVVLHTFPQGTTVHHWPDLGFVALHPERQPWLVRYDGTVQAFDYRRA